MGFRRKKSTSIDKAHWQKFCWANQSLIETIGLPLIIMKVQSHFEDLLMHGYLDHHHDPGHFDIKQLDEQQFKLFKELVDKYFAAGYYDPGLIVFDQEEIKALVKKYPTQFNR